MRYDIQQSKQMDDLLVLPGDLTDQNVAIAVNYLMMEDCCIQEATELKSSIKMAQSFKQ